MLCEKERCTGCGACGAVCKTNAISLAFEDGFLYPHIDEALCVNCRMCSRVCPVLNEKTTADAIYPNAYAAYVKNDEVLKNSASGGIAYALAEKIINNGGTAFGAVMTADMSVKITAANSVSLLQKTQGSKYVQSSTENTYEEAKQLLDSGKPVFYCGLPCQIAGLYGYLQKPYANLLTADIVCHGAPSPMLLKKYARYYEKINNCHLTEIRHRYKSQKWTELIQPTPAYIRDNGEIDVLPWQKDSYYSAFSSLLTYRKSCYMCSFAKMPRVSDITIGDFFGLGVIAPFNHKCDTGISQVIVNTKKGAAAFNALRPELFCEERSLYECMIFNQNLWRSAKQPAQRDNIISDSQRLSWEELSKKYFTGNAKMNYLTALRSAIKKILGPHLVAYFMHAVYKKQGLSDKVNSILHDLENNCKKI